MTWLLLVVDFQVKQNLLTRAARNAALTILKMAHGQKLSQWMQPETTQGPLISGENFG